MEAGFRHMELKKWRAADLASMYMNLMWRGYQPNPEGKFSTGQSVVQWWARWFATATEPKLQVAKGDRPRWYDATVIMAIKKGKCMYAGRMWCEPRYQVH